MAPRILKFRAVATSTPGKEPPIPMGQGGSEGPTVGRDAI
jgi:hypothetical protein